MSYFTHLLCRECGHRMAISPVSVCENCFGPLEVLYDYERIANALRKSEIIERPFTMWRYKEFLPISGSPKVGRESGGTPLIRAEKLGKHWGLKNLYIKNDAVNFPTLSFKDRVVSVAISAAIEFGFQTVGCASTGNLANSVAAQAAVAGLQSFIFIPDDLEEPKITATRCYNPTLVRVHGNYDEVNRLCSEIAYEQLSWRIPDAVVVPMAGGALINKISKAFEELIKVGYCEKHPCKIFGAQAAGCNPITQAVKNRQTEILPQRPNTIAKSLAIGNPADGYYAVKTIRESNGWGEDVSDEEILRGIELLAKTEGIFTETAGGVTVGVAEKLVSQGRIRPDEVTVLCITGNGLKTQDVLRDRGEALPVIDPKLERFHHLVEHHHLLQN